MYNYGDSLEQTGYFDYDIQMCWGASSDAANKSTLFFLVTNPSSPRLDLYVSSFVSFKNKA